MGETETVSQQEKDEQEQQRQEARQKAEYLFSQDFMLRKKIVQVLNGAGKYVVGSLPEQPIDLDKDYNGDPLIITIRVTCNVDRSEKTIKQETYAPEVSK